MSEEDAERWRRVGASVREQVSATGENGKRSQQEVAAILGVGQSVVSDDYRGPTRGIPRSRLIGYAELVTEATGADPYEGWVKVAYGRDKLN